MARSVLRGPPEVIQRAADRPRAGWGEDLVTGLLTLWGLVGLFVDGWAHLNLGGVETFLTPWHGILYSGITATAGWMGWQVARRRSDRRGGLAAVPVGYGLGLVGLGVFAVAGAADALWHTLFGIEADIEALYSPPHLALFAAGLLIASTPARAAWTQPGRAPRLGAFAPALLSLTLTTALVAFFWSNHGAFISGASTDASMGEVGGMTQLLTVKGAGDVLLTTVLLVGALLLVMGRWRTPPLTFTILFGAVAALHNIMVEFERAPAIAAALAGGLAADILIARLRPGRERAGAVRVIATVVPLVLWSVYFIGYELAFGIAWSLELWAGATVMAAFTGLGLSLVAVPPLAAPAGD